MLTHEHFLFQYFQELLDEAKQEFLLFNTEKEELESELAKMQSEEAQKVRHSSEHINICCALKMLTASKGT